MLTLRILTALILIPLVLLAIFYLPSPAFAAVTAIVFLLAGWEMAGLVGRTTSKQRVIYLLYLLIAFLISSWLHAYVVIIAALFMWGALLFSVCHYTSFSQFWAYSAFCRNALGICILAASWFSLVFIHFQPRGDYYVLFMLLFIWAADTGAYFTGRLWGKHKLAPAISPGKSIEGVIGGVIASVLVAGVIGFLIEAVLRDYLILILLGLIASLASVLGDLTESMIKRQANVKDSGNLLPGHGGLLDRIDSLLCVSPVLAGGLIIWSLWGS